MPEGHLLTSLWLFKILSPELLSVPVYHGNKIPKCNMSKTCISLWLLLSSGSTFVVVCTDNEGFLLSTKSIADGLLVLGNWESLQIGPEASESRNTLTGCHTTHIETHEHCCGTYTQIRPTTVLSINQSQVFIASRLFA